MRALFTSPHASIADELAQLKSQGANLTMAELLAYGSQSIPLPGAPSKQRASGQSGPIVSRFKGRGMEFDEVRHYQPGDDVRSIDWRVTARTGKAHTKLYREERERPVFVMVDFQSSMLFGSSLLFKSVQAAHVAANIAWRTVQRNDRIGGLIFDGYQHSECKPRARDKGALQLFHQLTDAHQRAFRQLDNGATDNTLEANLGRLQALVKTGADVYLISDFHGLTESASDRIRALQRHNQVHAVVIVDELELDLPSTNPQPVSVQDQSQRHELWLGIESEQQAYRQAAHHWLTQRLDLLKRGQVGHSLVFANQSLNQQWRRGSPRMQERSQL